MRRAQGSLECLLIVAAILAVAIVVVMVAQSMLGTPQASTRLTQDKYLAGISGVEFPDYTVFYDGRPSKAPQTLIYKGESYDIEADAEVNICGPDSDFPPYLTIN